MRRILYLCDRCGDMIEGNPLAITVEALDRKNNCETVAEVVTNYEKHFCRKCINAILRFATEPLAVIEEYQKAIDVDAIENDDADPEEDTEEADTNEVEKIEKAEEVQEVQEAIPQNTNKRYYLVNAEKRQIERMYLNENLEMEEIAKRLGKALPVVSKYINATKMGEIRYKGKATGGGSAVKNCTCYLGKGGY